MSRSQAWGGSGTDNTGNVTKAEMYVPNSDGSYNMLQDQYSYDTLNRLQSVNELQWGTQAVFTQAFTYDRWGNRQINQAVSSTNINTQQFGINTANNRLGVPSGQSGQMTFDASGNLTADTYSRADTSRVYDAENRLTTNTDTSNQVSRYTYDAFGSRVRRNINNQETWQVYGIGGELIAEYAANASPSSVQKEYGYRGGELLVTATSTADVEWLIGDHLGTPRMVVDKTGTLSGVKRHDYLPFGEEIFAGIGGRTAQQGYATDSVRQKFTKYERDSETGLDFAEARYFSSTQGRFTSTDPLNGSMRTGEPQTFNRYSYVGNNPVNRIDPSGMDWRTDASQRVGSPYYTNSLYELDRLPGAFGKKGDVRHNFDDFYDPEPKLRLIVDLQDPSKLLSDEQLEAMKKEIQRIYDQADIEIVFASKDARFTLVVTDKPLKGSGVSSDAAGSTKKLPSGKEVGTKGFVYTKGLTDSAAPQDDAASRRAFKQNTLALGIALGRAGAHEIGHWLLQQLRDSTEIRGVMYPAFKGDKWFSQRTQNLWTFDKKQIEIMRARVSGPP